MYTINYSASSMTLETTELRPSNDIAPSPQYPSAEELFAGIEEPNPHLIAAYDAYTSTSTLRKRDPGILSELVFGDEIRSGTITRKDADRAFRGLTDQLGPLLRAAGLNVVREKRSQKDELVHLGRLDTSSTAITRLGTSNDSQESKFMEVETTTLDHLAAITFKEPVTFPDAQRIRQMIETLTTEGSWTRTIAEKILADFENRIPTHDVALGRAFANDDTLDVYDAKAIVPPQIKMLGMISEKVGVTIAHLTTEDYTDRSNLYYTYADIPESGKTPRGKYEPSNAVPVLVKSQIPTPENTPPKPAISFQEKSPSEEFIHFPDPENKVISLEDVELVEGVRLATEEEIQNIAERFGSATRVRGVVEMIMKSMQEGNLAFLRPIIRKVFSDMDPKKGSTNLSATAIRVNKSSKQDNIQIASLRIPVPWGESGMFYALVQFDQELDIDPKHIMRLKPSLDPHGLTRQEKEPFIIPQPPTILDKTPHTPAETDVPINDDFIIPDADVEPHEQDASTSAETEDPGEKVFYDAMLDTNEIAMIRTLFGSDEERAMVISDIDRSVFPDKKKGKGHLRGTIAALDGFNRNLLNGSEVQIVEKPSTSNVHNREFYLQYPEGWSLDDVLRYVYQLRADQERLEQEKRASTPEPDSKPEPIDLEDGVEVLTAGLERKESEHTTDTEITLTEGEVAELTIGPSAERIPEEAGEQNPADPTETKRSGLSFSAKNVITALFGDGDGKAVRLHTVAELFRPGRNVKNDHLQSALLSVGNVKISSDSSVRIVQVASGRLDAYQFRLEYPEGWTLEQVLEYLESQSEQKPAENIILASAAPASYEPRREARSFVPDAAKPSELSAPIKPAVPVEAFTAETESTTYNEFAKLFQRDRNQEQIAGAPTIKIDLRKMEWHMNGKGGKIPFRELIPVLARLAKSPDGIDRFALAGLRSGDQNQKVIDQASRNFSNIQKALDDPERPRIFTSTGGGRYTTYRMIANIELV